jgi:hypothetical protein
LEDIMSQQYQQVLDQLEKDVEAALADAYRREGYVGDDGEPSDVPLREAAHNVLMDKAVVKSKADRSRKALTRGEFYTVLFPNGPDDDADLDPVQDRVLNKLLSTVWGFTQTTRSGYLQRQFEADESSLVLCRCQVYRKADARQAIYATDNEALILEDAVDKEIKSLVRRASALRRDLNMILSRHPGLEGAVRDKLGVELKKIDAELSFGTDTDGSKSDRKAIGAASAA